MIYENEAGIEYIINPKNVFSVACDKNLLIIKVISVSSKELSLHFKNEVEFNNFKINLLDRMLRY